MRLTLDELAMLTQFFDLIDKFKKFVQTLPLDIDIKK